MVDRLSAPFSNDHDLLIQLVEKVGNNHTNVMEKLRDIEDGTSKQLADHEIRIQAVEKVLSAVDIEKYKEDHLWIASFRGRWAIVVWAIGITSGVAGYIVSQILNIKGLFGR